MKEEKENHFLKFLGFFVGPIQFVMEVRCHHMSRSVSIHSTIPAAVETKRDVTPTRLYCIDAD